MHPNSLANLKPPYKPGENGHGRVYPLKERLRHALDHPLKEPPPNAPAGDHLVYATLKAALEVVPIAFRETWDRVEGSIEKTTPTVAIDNRQIHIHVPDQHTAELLSRITERIRGTDAIEQGQDEGQEATG